MGSDQTTIQPCEFCAEPSVEEVELTPAVTESRGGASVVVKQAVMVHVCSAHAASIRGGRVGQRFLAKSPFNASPAEGSGGLMALHMITGGEGAESAVDRLFRELKPIPWLHELAAAAIDEADTREDAEESFVQTYEDELNELLDCLADVKRGVRKLDELFEVAEAFLYDDEPCGGSIWDMGVRPWPTMDNLADKGLIVVVAWWGEEDGYIYRLTDAGKAYLSEHLSTDTAAADPARSDPENPGATSKEGGTR